MAREEAAMAFEGRACSMTTVNCGATEQAHTHKNPETCNLIPDEVFPGA
jgi:hypothetical protein